MATSSKGYTVRSSAVRAAKAAGLVAGQFRVIEDGGYFYFEAYTSKVEAVVDLGKKLAVTEPSERLKVVQSFFDASQVLADEAGIDRAPTNEENGEGPFKTADEILGTGASQVLADEIGSEDPTDAEIDESNSNDGQAALNNNTCPKCGGHELFCGQTTEGGRVIDEDHIVGCHSCDWVVDDRTNAFEAPAKKTAAKSDKSTAERPCKKVWFIADDMIQANPQVARKAVLAACVEAGVAFYTARTQYQQWLGVRKEMAAREATAS
jgi:DNA-directed RNA polymerase subunit M/transcription elongation factor TFIIS